MEKERRNFNFVKGLGEGESVIWSGKPRLLPFILPKLFMPIFFLVIWYSFFNILAPGVLDTLRYGVIEGDAPSWIGPVMYYAFMSPYVLIPLDLVREVIKFSNIHYTFTQNKIIFEYGLFSKHFKTLKMKEIKSIDYREGIIEKIFSVGTIYFNTFQLLQGLGVLMGNQDHFSAFSYIKNAQEIYQEIELCLATSKESSENMKEVTNND